MNSINYPGYINALWNGLYSDPVIMEENEYRTTYNKLVDHPCVFAKAINSTSCSCRQAARIQIADRIAINCSSGSEQQQCTLMLEKLRSAAQFVLRMPDIAGALPHNKEIRVQIGGIKGIAAILGQDESGLDIYRLRTQAQTRFGDLDKLPYSEIVRHIMQARTRRRSKTNK